MSETPEGWTNQPLAKFFKRLTRKNAECNQNALTISAQKGLVNQKEFFNKYVASSNLEGYYLLHKGDFAYNKSYSAGYPMGVIKRLEKYEKGVVSTLYICFEPTSINTSPDFFLKYFESGLFNSELKTIAQEGGRAHGLLNVSVKEFFDLLVPDVPAEEQQKIASILSSVDRVIDLTEQEINKLKDLKKGMMQELLTKGIGHTKFKDSPVGRIPESWKVSTVGKVCKIENNLRKPISRYEREKIKGSYPYYGPTKIQDYINEYRVSGTYALIGEDGDHFNKFDKQPMTQLAYGKFNVNNHAHLIGDSKNCSPEWFYSFFMHKDITSYLSRQGATRLKLTKAILEELPIVLPTKSEQLAIFDRISASTSLSKRKESKLRQLKLLKNGLMQDLLTGKVRVKI